MRISRKKSLAIGLTVLGALLAGATVATAAQRPTHTPTQSGPAATQGVQKPITKADDAKAARAARVKAREKANDLSWAAFTAARREPRSVLKGITLTSSVKNTARFMEERYLDRFEELNKADRNAYRTDADTSTLITDIMTIRLEQRAELRAVLTRAQQVQFDTNVAILVALKN